VLSPVEIFTSARFSSEMTFAGPLPWAAISSNRTTIRVARPPAV
jgi:hypothetical protein